ncbi:hypothetical protein OESDEN_00747 [Oesophagostomum dentatum]|uniref:DM13 domain-containing protein n=1 Tax=Oesophagostomum dentatum TaxID=61180 RepID=A0A0B1TNZ4_OESDE|nr:hypothetical protein OESDEN_00747 [Oesophagostomum dentatum]
MMIGPPREEDAKRKIGSYNEDKSSKKPQEFSSLNPDESYEEIEYVEDEEETEEREESVNHLLPTFKDGETHRRPTTTSTTGTTTEATTAVIFPTLVTAVSALEYTKPMYSYHAVVIGSSKRAIKKHSPFFQELHDDLSSNHIIETAAKAGKYDSSFSLPPAQDEQVAFLLTNGGRLSDYKWIGLYDQCKNESVPLISLVGVDPPREEEVGTLIGLQRNISSRSVRILNCNTILVSGLHFEADQNLPNSFFFVGVGNITDIVQQTKARTIGYELGDPLEPFTGDDVMVRLPRRIRTFDVDFLSIYNEDEKQTYGYVNLPSLLVPPCVDDL